MKITTAQQKQDALDSNKMDLVLARRLGDEDRQKVLSQERQNIKSNRFCIECGVKLTTRKHSTPMTHCRMHKPRLLSMKIKRWIALVLVLFTLPLMAAPSGNTGGAYVYFSFPAPLPDFSAYWVYYGLSSSNYTWVVFAGSSTNLSLSGLTRGQKYFINVTQTTTNGIESDYTTEFSLIIPNKPPKAQALAAQVQ